MKDEFVKVEQSKSVEELLEKAKHALLLGFKIEINKYADLYSMSIYK